MWVLGRLRVVGWPFRAARPVFYTVILVPHLASFPVARADLPVLRTMLSLQVLTLLLCGVQALSGTTRLWSTSSTLPLAIFSTRSARWK